ncbi:DUF485 domain-containing protein [Streptomyces muensis]|uniref:DUF485 domain-containing protein n=1 Tax=Streptomyces muensis TaxID=1077944 RepID=A0A9X1Q819_STRM4|nr:DUF485 domain-containing protein [Streptomyces muensis]MCF1600211.1 DUF485 domain-containing protein [Streptomyces muensis]
MSLYPPSNGNLRPPPDFRSIRTAQRSFGVAATLVSVGGFLTYVLLSGFAAGVMNQPLAGHLTIGLALGLFQFLLMAVTIWLYVRHMRRRVDPVADRLRAQLRDSRAQAEAQAQAQAQARRTPAGRWSGTW